MDIREYYVLHDIVIYYITIQCISIPYTYQGKT